MNPIVIKAAIVKTAALAVGALAAFEGWHYLYPKLQSLRSTNAQGHPIQVVVPVQKKIITLKGIKGQASAPLPPNNGTSATFIPPPAAPTGKLGNEPTVITPSGAANLSVDNVSDIQNSLNALGQQPPISVTGKNDPPTQSAIASFQGAHGMAPDGQPSAALRTALQAALVRVAGTQGHVGQSIPVQAAGAPGAMLALNIAASPAGQALVQTGLSAIANAFSDDSPDTDVNADSPSNKPAKDAVVNLQRCLNMLGAKPPLEENGEIDAETTAAIKALQITYGLVADGVPGPKTATTVAVALTGLADPQHPAGVTPTLPKAADHVALVASDAPATTKQDLTDAAGKLATAAASTPIPTDAQTHASTAAAQAATASSAAPTAAIAVPLANAANALAGAANAPAPDPSNLASASAALSTAAAAANGTTSAPSLAAAASHVAAAASAPDIATAGDHLNAAAQHLANASVGTPTANDVAASANGEFGWDFFGLHTWWNNRTQQFHNWYHRMHPAYQPPVPYRYVAGYHGENFGFDLQALRNQALANSGQVPISSYIAPPTGYGASPPPPPPGYNVTPPPAPGQYPQQGPYGHHRRHRHHYGPPQQQYGGGYGGGYNWGYGGNGNYNANFGVAPPPPPPRPAPPTGRYVAPPPAPGMVYPPPAPGAMSDPAYYATRAQNLGYGGYDNGGGYGGRWDRPWRDQMGQSWGAPAPAPWAPGPPMAPPPVVDPNAANQYQDPNAAAYAAAAADQSGVNPDDTSNPAASG